MSSGRTTHGSGRVRSGHFTEVVDGNVTFDESTFCDGEPHEYTDVVFRGVVAHHFEHVLTGNILLDVDESEIATLVQDLFANSCRYGWPPVEYNGDLNRLVDALRRFNTGVYDLIDEWAVGLGARQGLRSSFTHGLGKSRMTTRSTWSRRQRVL